MNEHEALKLCRLAKALSPAQAVDDYTPDAWALVLRDTRFADAEQALVQLGGEQEWIHVSHIKARVKRIRTERIREFGQLPEPPPQCAEDPAEYANWYAETIRQIADGQPVDRPALVAATPEHVERMKALIGGAFQMPADEEPGAELLKTKTGGA